MPRRGGPADKLGNRFEGIWTVDILLDLIWGESTSVTVEPIGDEDAGIEFVAVTSTGVDKYYSIKRQHFKGHWTVARLDEAGVIEDLIAKTRPAAIGVFCSGTSATGLEELIDSASESDSFESFERRTRQSDNLEGDLEDHVATLFEGDVRAAYEALKRLRVETENEARLIKNVERRIKIRFRMDDGSNLNPRSFRLLLGDLVIDHSRMGKELTEAVVISFLEEHGVRRSDLLGDATAHESIRRCNERYLVAANGRLINGALIERADADRVLNELLEAGQSVTIEGDAGGGKSCIAAQVVAALEAKSVPCLALSLDRLSEADTTAEHSGLNRGLPHSPTATLGEYAGSRRSVLVLDQLDALSQAFGRRGLSWDVVNEILVETRNYPEMRVLFACRSFDLQQDSDLKALGDRLDSATRITVEDLTEEEISEAIAVSGVATPVPNSAQLKVLASPLHLSLFLDVSTGGPVDFTASGDLFDKFWELKAREVDRATTMVPSAWEAANAALCNALSAREMLLAPEHAMGPHLHTIRNMASASVVRIDDGEVQYFHEAFFDYAFARNFLSAGHDLVQWLLADDQHLFRRSQVRQVLAFLRRHPSERATYLQSLRELLESSGIRPHIKILVLDWLRALPDPSEAEWQIVENLEPVLGDHIWRVVGNSLPWFDLFDQMGRWASWLEPANDKTDQVAALFLQPDVLGSRTERVISLMVDHRDESLEWGRRLIALVHSRSALRKPELRILLVELLSDGTFDEQFSDLGVEASFWTILHLLNQDDPEFAAYVLGVWLDRLIHTSRAHEPADLFRSGSPLVQYDGFSNDAIQECATRAPSTFAREILARFIELDRLVPHAGLWGPDPFGMPDRFFRAELIRTLRGLACDDPSQLDSITSDVIRSDFPATNWTASVLLDAWTENPERYADRILDALIERTELWLEPENTDSISKLDSYLEVSRRALSAAAPYCSDEAIQRIESEILYRQLEWEQSTDLVGRTELELLLGLPNRRLRPAAVQRITELRSRFPDAKPVRMTRSLEAVNEIRPVPSPLSLEGKGPYSDAQWLSAMQRYRDPSPSIIDGHFVGGSRLLVGDLEEATRNDPERFVSLVHRMDNRCVADYFEAVLAGLVRDETGRQHGDQSPRVITVLRHIEQTGVTVRGGEIARAVSSLAQADLPSDIVEMLRAVALHDPDPAADDWQGSGGWRSPIDQAINSARGAAGQSIAGLLAARPARWVAFGPVVERLVEDPVLAVRTTAVQCLAAVLHAHQDEALTLFSKLTLDADSILGTTPVEAFIHSAIFRDYESVRSILLVMLESDHPKAVGVAGRQLTVAALYIDSDEARDDGRSVLEMGPVATAAAASIYAANLTNEAAADMCEARLLELIGDDHAEVRNAAANWMRLLTPNDVAERGSLIAAQAGSGSIGGQIVTLARRLDEATVALPIEICSVAEVSLAEDPSRVSSAFHLAPLVIRLYGQHHNGLPQDRARILDLIDKLVWLGAYGIDNELRRLDERYV
jgi:hypothetical protein